MGRIKKKLFLDFDGVIVNTIYTICSLYNEDFCKYTNYHYVDWTEIESWEFQELNCATREYIDIYFNQPRFFQNIRFMEHADYIMGKLSEKYDITIVSMGDAANLKLKEEWISENIPYCEFVGCDFKDCLDKSHIDMSGATFVDDSVNNLESSNASKKICFGDIYKWNEDWDGIRCWNWYDVLSELEM